MAHAVQVTGVERIGGTTTQLLDMAMDPERASKLFKDLDESRQWVEAFDRARQDDMVEAQNRAREEIAAATRPMILGPGMEYRPHRPSTQTNARCVSCGATETRLDGRCAYCRMNRYTTTQEAPEGSFKAASERLLMMAVAGVDMNLVWDTR